MLFLFSFQNCTQTKEENEAWDDLDRRTRIRLMQYISQGKVLYNQYCANCHQEDGLGYKKLYPPLKGADYMKEDLARTVCIIKNGQQGPIEVNGQSYNLAMPNNLGLSELEIAEITTFIYNRFADTVMIINPKEVKQILEDCEMPVVY